MQYQLDSRFREVEAFVDRACASNIPEEVQSYLFKLGSVLVCGYVERSIEIIVLTRLADKAHPRVLNFVKSYFTRGTNFNCTAIEQLLARFDSEWYREFQKFVEANSDIKDGISSCYSIRNSVAHGGSASVTSTKLRDFLNISQRLITAVVMCTR
ncbi:HEPN domain-containing protein [Thalassobaculum sp.]|uniref:HEPN domain-containing protein n=1 Tax=Thalassobaculum sp. TaxID=2022740 RepID=UPI0032EDAA11